MGRPAVESTVTAVGRVQPGRLAVRCGGLPFSGAVRVGDTPCLSGRYPARSALGANGLALGARVEVECVAAVAR
jgi:isoaspartyl peptidase/L-asparaginase-like protein (Ntn-hydrolase superfamily)